MENQWIHPCTLLPRKQSMKEAALELCEQKLNLLTILYIFSCAIAVVTEFIRLMVQLGRSGPYKKELAHTCACLIRMAIYFSLFLFRRVSNKVQAVGICVLPLIYSVIVTEVSLYLDKFDNIFVHLLAGEGIFLLALQHTLFNYMIGVIPVALSNAYPFLREICNPTSNGLAKNEMLIFDLLHIVGIGIIATYFARKFTVTDLAAFYLNRMINEQWKLIINSLKNGQIIMSEESPPALLYYNPFAEKIAQNICHITNQKLSMQELLARSTIKILRSETDSGQILRRQHSIVRQNFLEWVEKYSEESFEEGDCFLDVPELLVEVKVHKVIFDNKEAKLVSLTDCTAARSLEQAKSECKYKTTLISSISHELRTPVNSILGTLELVKDFIPKDSVKLLEMSKECCDMITAHINDLTVSDRISF
eukprot:TRINITY_DN2801_c0_g1_i4.p1 TRINITY_DN2801_c0_g1~~TRINITY_DN2801_c0_g1_i4.p1  ORF type:complete len:421 (+),score=72.19 TRINITY_DN2801_c0_g1_i4:336-1598(+)